MKSLVDFVLDGLKDPMTHMRACKMNFKQPQNEARLNSKPTPRSKGDRTKVEHMRREHLQRQHLG
jgi:hypothetical protein